MSIKEEKSELRGILERFSKNELTSMEYDFLHKWVDSLPHEKGEIELSETDRVNMRNKILYKINKRNSTDNAIPILLKIAATVLVFMITLYFFHRSLYFYDAPVVYVNNGDNTMVKKMFLPDSTLIWLKGKSSVRYPQDNTRRVTLTGEALFEITKDPSRPFTVHCELGDILVLGTSFNLKSDGRYVKIEVLTGKVSLLPTKQKKAIVIFPGEKITYHAGAITVDKEKLKPEEIKRIMAGTDYDMNFEEERLYEVVERVEDKFGVNIEFTDETFNNHKISGDFTDTPLDVFLHTICTTFGTTYVVKGNKIIIKEYTSKYKPK